MKPLTVYTLFAFALALVGRSSAGPPITTPEVPLTPVRLISPTPLTSIILPPASEPYGVYLMLVRVDDRASTPKPLPSRTPYPQ